MIQWSDHEVTDHSGGITDLITSTDPGNKSFQEVCRNLGHNVKLQLLSSREGYSRYISTPLLAGNDETPTKIQQLFKLEDWIIAYCHADAAAEGDQVSGKLYYRLENDISSAWTEIETPKARTALTFRVYDSFGKGCTISKSSGTLYDQLMVFDSANGAGPTYAPSMTLESVYKAIYLGVSLDRLDNDGYYATGSGDLTWAWFETTFGTAGFTVTRFSNTLSTDKVSFTEVLTPVDADSVFDINDGFNIWPVAVRADGSGTSLSAVNEQGHLKPSEWQGHLFLALEPYVKTYTANASDIYGEDVDTYPPDNNRLPLRKIAPVAKAPGLQDSSNPPGYALKVMNAQLPKVLIGTETTETTENTYPTEAEFFRYQVYKIQFSYQSSAYVSDDSPWIEIWAERSWGNLGPPGNMTIKSYLAYTYFAATKNPLDNSKQFGIADVNLSALAPYTGIATLATDWNMLYLCYHEQNSAGTDIPSMTYASAVAAIEAAFTEYTSRRASVTGTYYYSAYESFGFYVRSNPKAKQDESIDVTAAPTISYRYADNLPEGVGNHTYGYAFYLRETYQGALEGSPREFIFNGPAAFLSVRTLSPIGKDKIKGYDSSARTLSWVQPRAPAVYGGITSRIADETDLYYQSTLEGVFARTLDGGDVYYIDTETKYWWRSADATTIGEFSYGLILDGWWTKTSFIVPWQSQMTDDDLQYEEQAYFNGGVLSYDPLPQGPYYFDIVNQTGVAANIVGNIQRAYISPPGAPYASPATIFEDFDDEITGVSHFADKPVITTRNRIWRIEGTKGSDGSGRIFLRTVSDEFGCVANQSIVSTNLGLFLFSSTGIVYTDGLRALRVTDHLIETYKGWLDTVSDGGEAIGPRQLRGTYDKLNRKVYWSLYDTDGKPFFVVLSLQKGISTMMPVTTEDGIRFRSVDSGTGTVTNIDYFETHASLYSDDTKTWYRGQDTFLMSRDSSMTYDESHVDDLRHPIMPYMKSVAYSFGLTWAQKQTSTVMWTLRDMTETGVSLTPLGWNDLSTSVHRLQNCLSYQHMNYASDYATGSLLDLEQFFRHSDCRWKSKTVVTYKRRFGRGKSRNIFKQVGFEAMKLKYSEITADTSGITLIEVIHKAGFPEPTVFIEITVDNVVSNAVADLELDASGQFYVTFDPQMEPLAISDVSRTGSTYRIIVLPDGEGITNVTDQTISWPELSFYRVFTDQKVDLIGYNLTYRLIGDLAHGGRKSAEHGGVDA